MNNINLFSRIFLLLSIALLFLFGCEHTEGDKAKITIRSRSQLNAAVKVIHYIELGQRTIGESKTDSTGSSSFEIILQKPMFVNIQIGEKYGEIYLAPGYDLQIMEADQEDKIPLTFSGKGANVNNYISWVNSTVEGIKWAKGKGLNELTYDEFLNRFDSLKTTINNFHTNYIDSVSLPIEIASKLEKKNTIKLLAIVQEFNALKLMGKLNSKEEAQNNGIEYSNPKQAKEFEMLTNEIPLEPALLEDGYLDYEQLLTYYWGTHINLRVREEIRVSKTPIHKIPLLANALIKKGDYPKAICEFLIAFDLKYRFTENGITPETDSVFNSFKRAYPHSDYLAALNKNYDEWLAVAPGKPAPKLEGYTLEGKKISIKDLKGKVIYIDVWATWCGPCVAEIPSSKKLQQEFAGDDRIEFMNVSVDSRKPDWEKFLSNDKAWKGLHINIEADKIDSLYSRYKLLGVPTYILIDPLGNIVNMKAPRPSDAQTMTEIRKLLAKEL